MHYVGHQQLVLVLFGIPNLTCFSSKLFSYLFALFLHMIDQIFMFILSALLSVKRHFLHAYVQVVMSHIIIYYLVINSESEHTVLIFATSTYVMPNVSTFTSNVKKKPQHCLLSFVCAKGHLNMHHIHVIHIIRWPFCFEPSMIIMPYYHNNKLTPQCTHMLACLHEHVSGKTYSTCMYVLY